MLNLTKEIKELIQKGTLEKKILWTSDHESFHGVTVALVSHYWPWQHLRPSTGVVSSGRKQPGWIVNGRGPWGRRGIREIPGHPPQPMPLVPSQSVEAGWRTRCYMMTTETKQTLMLCDDTRVQCSDDIISFSSIIRRKNCKSHPHKM